MRKSLLLPLIGLANLGLGFLMLYLPIVVYPTNRDVSELPLEGFVFSMAFGLFGLLSMLVGVALIAVSLVRVLNSLLQWGVQQR